MLEGLPEAIKARRLHWVAEPCSFKTTVEYAVLARAAKASNSTALILRAQSLDTYRDPTLTQAMESLLYPHATDQNTTAGSASVAEKQSDAPLAHLNADKDTPIVWVIIPVFDASASLDRCLASITVAKNKTSTHVLIVDDASPDPGVSAVLRKYSEQAAIHVIRRKVNGGFSAAVNTGITAVGRRDVIVLNSDTVVTDHWVDKLRQCAYASTDIAGACPLSNNAELLSMPSAMRATPIPNVEAISAINKFLEKQNVKTEPLTIAAGVGFCWYLKATTIETIGLFDQTLIEHGYGEDTDYSVRISKAGLRTVAARDTFVGHEGSQSFKASKKALAAQNNRRLAQLYPDHFLAYEQCIQESITQRLSQKLQHFLIQKGHIPSCPLYQLTASQWDHLTHVSCIPAMGLVATDDTTLQIRAHRIPVLDHLTIKRPSERDEIQRSLNALLGTPKRPFYSVGKRTQLTSNGRRLKLDANCNTVHRVLVPYLKTPSSGYFEVVKLAKAISKCRLNFMFVVIGPTVCDRELARHACVELAGAVKGEQLQQQAALLKCSAIFIAHANPFIWELELAEATGLPLLWAEEINAAIKPCAR